MKLGQVKWNGAVTAAVFEGGLARPIPDYTVVDLILRAEKEGETLPGLATRLATRHPLAAEPLIPLQPREVWACGSTYESSALERDNRIGNVFCMQAHRAERPEILFKGTARVCVGPGQAIGIRPDSSFTAPAPELALILGANGRILGYTLANDLSACDLEFENPLYRTQAKSYTASCALGSLVTTADEITDPRGIEIRCEISRNGSILFSSSASTAQMERRLESLVEYLLLANPVPAGSVLLTGSGIRVPRSAALEPGDQVSIRSEQLGELHNPAMLLGYSPEASSASGSMLSRRSAPA